MSGNHVRTAVATLGVNATNLAFGVLTGVATARGLDPHERGLFLALILWAGLLSAAALFGAQQSVIFHAKGDHASAVAYAIAVGRASFKEISLLLWRSRSRLSSWAGDTTALPLLVVAACLVVPCNAIVQLILASQLAGGRVGAWNLIRLVPGGAYAGLSALLLASDRFSVVTAMMAWSAGNLASLGLAVGVFRWSRPPSRLAWLTCLL